MIDTSDQQSHRRQQRGERRIDSLIEAAEAVFAEIGYERATTNLIAERASASPGTLYQFFPNKQALAESLAKRYTDRLSEMFRESFGADKAKVPLRQLIDSLVAYFFSFHLKAPAFYNLLLASAISGDLRQRLNAFLDVAADRIAGLMRTRTSALSEDDAALVARVCVAIWEGVAPLFTSAGHRRQKERVIEQLKIVFERYLAPLEAPDASLKEQ